MKFPLSFRALALGLCVLSLAARAEMATLSSDTPMLLRTPDGKTRKLGTLRSGSQVEVLKRSAAGKWAGVRYKGHKGWISASALSHSTGANDGFDETAGDVNADGTTENGGGEKSAASSSGAERPLALDLIGTWSDYTGIGVGAGVFVSPWVWPHSHVEVGGDVIAFVLNKALPVGITGIGRFVYRLPAVELGAGPWLAYSMFISGSQYSLGGSLGYGLSFRADLPAVLGLFAEARMGLRGGVGFSYLGGIRLTF